MALCLSLTSLLAVWEVRVGKSATKPEIDTVSKRSKLKGRKNPYWLGVGGGRGGTSLGYRKSTRGPGVWIAKIVVDGSRVEEKIAVADDDGAPAGSVSYRAAVAAAIEWGGRQYSAIDARRQYGTSAPTVRSSIQPYVDARSKRSEKEGGNALGRLTKYVLADADFADTPLAKLRSSTIEAWRARLPIDRGQPAPKKSEPKLIKPSTLNRLLNDLRAALNAAAVTHRRELPANIATEIKVGTKAESVEGQARKQLLTDEQIRAAVEAAFEVDEDFGHLCMLAAATGARYSQLAAAALAALQIPNRRIMMPGAKKGRSGRSRPPVAVPLSDDIIARLAACLKDRGSDEPPLLTRWAYRNVEPFKWERDHRRPWGPAYEVDPFWTEVIEKAKLPTGTIMYAFRHSSIVRQLRAGLPVRLVASLHDTSIEMIEKHYSAFIVDMSEDLARRTVFSVKP